MAENSEPEEAVRRYLIYLEDPSKLRDETEVQRRTLAVLEAHDPIEKLKALAALEKASAVDEPAVRAGFVEHARGWAEANGVSVRAFQELSVPADVLVEAGFEIPAGGRRRTGGRGGPSGRSTAPAAADSRGRRPMVSTNEIKQALGSFTEPFTISEVMAKVGGSPLTVRKAIDELIDEGRVRKLGPVPDYAGRGRAPVQYALA